MTVRAFLRIIHINQFRTVQSCSRVQCFEIPWTAAHQAPLSIEFSGQEYWNGLPFPIPEDFPNPGIKPTSLASSALSLRFFTTAPPGKPKVTVLSNTVYVKVAESRS